MNDRVCDTVLMVVPSINGEKLLARMLPTLRCNPSCVVVLDQGSIDHTESLCAEFGVECVQLGHPVTYTQACNIGAQMARDRGLAYLCVSNNDIVFRTDVLSELLSEMEQDPSLGIVAPTQVVVNEAQASRVLTTRVFWRLNSMDFGHDLDMPPRQVARLESDFCELTCALIRMSSVAQVGFLDDQYGFYHEDADFGFRLRRAGWNCAYLQHSQIDHYTSSTFDKNRTVEKLEYIRKNKIYFATKHLGYGTRQILNIGSSDAYSEEAIKDLIPYLRAYGLIEPKRPEMVVGNPGADTRDYLYNLSATDGIPERWSRHSDRYEAVFTISNQLRDEYLKRGFSNVFSLPPAVETDIYHPWVVASRLNDATTYLAIVDGQERLISTLLKAWLQFRGNRRVRLVVFGRGISDCMGRGPDESLRIGRVNRLIFNEESVEVHEIISPFTPAELAQLYKSVDFTISAAGSVRSARAALQSIACGIPCLLPQDAPLLDRALVGSLDIGQSSALSVENMLAVLKRAQSITPSDRAELSASGVRSVRSSFTLRHSAMAFYAALTHIQPSSSADILCRLSLQPAPDRRPHDSRALTALIAEPEAARRLSRTAARWVAAFGNLTAQFGTIWNEYGLSAATRKTSSDIQKLLAVRRGSQPKLPTVEPAKPSKKRSEGQGGPLAPRHDGLLLIGYIDAQLGLGQSSRGLAEAMALIPLDFHIYPVTKGVEGRRGSPFMEERYDRVRPHALNIIEVTPDELPAVLEEVGRGHFDRSYNVLRAYWELSRAPDAWRSKIAGIDEIWAPNRFVAESLQTIFNGPITVIPPCVSAGTPQSHARDQFGLQRDLFYFLFSFDYFSFPQRKNPLGAVRSFQAAFKDRSLPVGLVVKSAGRFDHFPELKREMQDLASCDGRITIIDETLSRQEMINLFSASDCYVSLHRSEGFGLGMVEAMLLGKPVIATDYSGSADFLSEKTGYPVPFQLREVKPDEYVHTEGQVWAEPDEQACAAMMRQVAETPLEAAARGAAAKGFVSERYGKDRVGRLVAQRLREINRGWSDGAAC